MLGSREFSIEYGRKDAQALKGEHLFERAGMGKAPFRCVSYICRDGSCNYCGTPNKYAAVIESADGKRHEVGMDCAEKVGDAGLVKGIKNSAEYREFQRAKRHAKDEAVTAELPALIERVRGVNEAVATYYSHRVPYCGATGRAKLAREMRRFLEAA
jgi:hypothetical protein